MEPLQKYWQTLDPQIAYSIFLSLLCATIWGAVIAITYYKTHRGYSFSQNFANTLIILTVVTAFIILIIGDNIARAIGIFGAFSIIRFRTAVKDARDTAFVFFALASGLAAGTGSILIGTIGTVFLSVLIFALYQLNFSAPQKADYVFNFRLDTDEPDQDGFKKIFDQYLKNKQLLHVDAKKKGKVLAFTFNGSLKRGEALKDFIQDLNNQPGISSVNVVNAKNSITF